MASLRYRLHLLCVRCSVTSSDHQCNMKGQTPCDFVLWLACRSWHQLATSDDLWRQHLQLVFPGSGKKQQQGPKQSRQWNKRLHDFAQQAAVDSAAAASAAGFAAQVHGSNSNSSSRDEQQGDTGAYQRFCKAAQCEPSRTSVQVLFKLHLSKQGCVH